MNTLFSYFTKVERPRPSDPANVSLDLSSEDEMTPKRMKAGKKVLQQTVLCFDYNY